MISLVIDFCFNILSQCWTLITSIELIPGVSLMSFCLGLVVISVVIFGLISTVKIVSGLAVGSYGRAVDSLNREAKRDAREAERNSYSTYKANRDRLKLYRAMYRRGE